MGLGTHRHESRWREACRHGNHCPGESGAERCFVQYKLLTPLLHYQIRVGGSVCQKQRGTTKWLVISSHYIIQFSCTHDFYSRAGSAGKMLERGPARLQPGIMVVKEAMPNTPHQAREAGCQPGTMKTTLKLSRIFFVLLSCLRMF